MSERSEERVREAVAPNPPGDDPVEASEGAENPDEHERHVREHVDLMEALGGPQGVADSALPALAFVIAYTASGNDLGLSIWIAVAAGAVMAGYRVIRRETLQYALAGFAGVAIAAFVAERTGRAEDFFLPGLLLNAGYALAYLISILVRWPLLGIFIGPLTGENFEWRKDPERVRLYTLASWVWVGVFSIRLVVQLPLYFSGAVLALGIAKAAMGLPIFAIGIWLSYLILKGGADPHDREAADRMLTSD